MWSVYKPTFRSNASPPSPGSETSRTRKDRIAGGQAFINAALRRSNPTDVTMVTKSVCFYEKEVMHEECVTAFRKTSISVD
jgi:hypothetical protein